MASGTIPPSLPLGIARVILECLGEACSTAACPWAKCKQIAQHPPASKTNVSMKLSHFPLILLPLLSACSRSSERQDIDLSDAVVVQPEDGVGHYVYALSIPAQITAGESFEVQMEWRTVGSVDPNARYTMDLLLSGPQTQVYSLPSGANTVGELHLANWLSYPIHVPEFFTPGVYTLGVRLRDEKRDGQRVPLGFKPELILPDGYYRLAQVALTAPE